MASSTAAVLLAAWPHRAARSAACGWIILRHASQCLLRKQFQNLNPA